MRWLVWLLCGLPLCGYWLTGLFDLDEGFYGAISREMLRRGDWITPHYNGAPWFEKPILVYWLAAPSIAVFGEDFGPRLPSVLCAIGLYWLTWRMVRRDYDELAANLAALMLASSLLVVACSRQLMTDMPLVLAEMAASYSFWRSLTEGRHWRLLTAFWLGVSVLAKGPVGVILFLILMGCTYWREPALRPKFAGYWGLGGLIFFAVVATWTVPAFLTNREFFVQEFLIRQNIGRFAGGDIAHTPNRLAGLLVYLPILLLGAFPWSFALPKAWKALAAHDPFVRYNFRWFITVFIFFTVTGAKLMHYVLPAVPAMIVIVAIYAADRWRTRGEVRPMRPLLAPIVGILVTTLLVNVGQWWYYGGATFAMPGKELKFNAPYQEELHSCTKVARNRKLPIVVYQMGKRPGAQTLLQETSHPSVVYYANDVVGVAESPGDLERLKRPYALLTRVSRITPELKKQLIGQGATPFMGGIQYVIWRVP